MNNEIRHVCRQENMRRKRKAKSGMYAGRENTCVGNENEIRHVCRQGKHMRRKRKTKSGMYAGRENTCVESEKKSGMYASRENTARKRKNKIRHVENKNTKLRGIP